ncbi:MAG: beta-N-acetylglucosaminidase domain-containing protein, partial [bacterium]|nr:beta-N-acetylglucosaminidase domain-containing protein [bacterium]
MIITYDTNYTNPGGGGIKIYINSGKQLSGGDQRTKSEQSADKPQLAEGPPFFTGKILPTPQKVEYLNKFIPVYSSKSKSATACILISKDGSKDDARIIDLSSRIQGLGGKIDIIKDGEDISEYSTIISIGDNKLNAKYLKQNKLTVPDKAEGYLLYPLGEKERNIILCAGHDKLGEYWGIQSLRQLLTKHNGAVCFAAAKVFDYPAFHRRGYAVPYFGHDRLQHFKFAPEYKFNVTFNTPTVFLTQFNGWNSWQETIHKEGLEKVKDIAGYLNQRGISLVLSIHGKSPRVYGTMQKANKEIHISEESDVQAVASMLGSFLDAGADGIGIWYDDSCFPIYAKDKEKFGDAAHAHAYLINKIHASLKKDHPNFKFFFVPPFYMSNWEYEGLGKYEDGNSYLRFLGKNTPSDVEIFWTGPHVISTKVTQDSSKQWVELLGRKTAFFDNVFGGPHPGFWYYFDPKDFKTQFPAEFQEFLSTYMMAGYTFGHYRVCLATLSDYLWNPKSYNPEESLKAAIAQIAGPDMYPLLMDWREKVSKFDQFGEGNVSPGAQNMLQQLRMWLEELKTSFEQVKQQCRNPLVVSGMGWHTGFWEKFVVKVENAGKQAYEKAVAQVRDQAYKETGAKADDIFITPYDFIGGCKGFTGGIAKNERRHAAWVYGTKNAGQMSSDFNLPANSIKDCKLVISGFVSDKSFRMRILVNNNPIFEGMDKDSGFNNEKWVQKEFLLNSNFLKAGKNTLLIENLEDKGFIGADPWFMLNYAVIKK